MCLLTTIPSLCYCTNQSHCFLRHSGMWKLHIQTSAHTHWPYEKLGIHIQTGWIMGKREVNDRMLTEGKLEEISTNLNIPLENPLHTLYMRPGFSFRFSPIPNRELQCVNVNVLWHCKERIIRGTTPSTCRVWWLMWIPRHVKSVDARSTSLYHWPGRMIFGKLFI